MRAPVSPRVDLARAGVAPVLASGHAVRAVADRTPPSRASRQRDLHLGACAGAWRLRPAADRGPRPQPLAPRIRKRNPRGSHLAPLRCRRAAGAAVRSPSPLRGRARVAQRPRPHVLVRLLSTDRSRGGRHRRRRAPVIGPLSRSATGPRRRPRRPRETRRHRRAIRRRPHWTAGAAAVCAVRRCARTRSPRPVDVSVRRRGGRHAGRRRSRRSRDGSAALDGTPDRARAPARAATTPAFVHHPLILAASGEKLSKSNRDVGLAGLRADGGSPEETIGRAAAAVGLIEPAMPLTAADVAGLVGR